MKARRPAREDQTPARRTILFDRSMYEPLTGLASRHLFEDRTNQALARAAREGWTTAVFRH